MNLVDATVDGDAACASASSASPFADGRPPAGLGEPGRARHPAGELRGRRVRAGAADDLASRIEVLEELGSDAHVFFHVDAPPITAEILEAAADGGLPDGRALFTARVDAQTAARVGQMLELAVDPRRFHFFDPTTGARLDRERARPRSREAR